MRHLFATIVCLLVLGATVQTRAQVDSLRVRQPDGGERWRIGSTQEIQWESDGLGLVSIYYAVSALSPQQVVVEHTPDDGSFLWTIPDDPTHTARVLILEDGSQNFDRSDFDFLMLPERGAAASLWLSSAPDAVVNTAQAGLFEFAELWILAEAGFDPPFAGVGDGLLGWEASLALPPEIVVTQLELFPAGALNLGVDNADYRVGLGACIPDVATPTAVARVQVLVIGEVADAWIDFEPASVSSFAPATPGWLSCLQPRELLPMDSTEGLLFNPGPVASPLPREGGLSVEPNPSGGLSRLRFAADAPRARRVRIVDLRGRVVRHLEGTGELVWDGKNDAGHEVAAGVYGVLVRGEAQVRATRIVRLR